MDWQLTSVILASVFIGALIPLFIMMALAVYRAGKGIAEIGARLTRTLTQVEIISDRVEVLSRGFRGGEENIADLLTSLGSLARGLERNMKIVNISSTILASVGTAIAAFASTRAAAKDSGIPLGPDVVDAPDRVVSPPPVPPEARGPHLGPSGAVRPAGQDAASTA